MTIIMERHQFTTADFARMRASGILTEEDRVELIDGEVRTMSPIGSLHAAIVNRLTRLLGQHISADMMLSVQNPIQLNDYSQPQPDLMILHQRDDDYASGHPVADDIVLLIEVADTSISFDRDEKLPRYALANIAEVWLVDVSALVVEQYREPRNGKYRVKTLFEYDDTIVVEQPALRVAVGQIFS